MNQFINKCVVIDSEIHKHRVGREQANGVDVLGTVRGALHLDNSSGVVVVSSLNG